MNYNLQGLFTPTFIAEGFGGNSVNSTHLVRAYGLDKVHDLSLNATSIAQVFSATDRYNNKPLVAMTEAKGRKTYLTSDTFSWKLRGHSRAKARVTDVIEDSEKPGLGLQEFKVVLDKGWYKEPDVLISGSNKYPLEVVGRGAPRTQGGWEYTLRLQTDDPNLYLPVNYIQTNQEFMKTSTSVANEMNQDYGTIHFESVFELRSQLGQVAEKFEFTDKALRVNKNGQVSEQLKHWRVPFLDRNGQKYDNFMPLVEAELMNQVYMDIEWSLEFGRKSMRPNPQGYLKKTGPGLRQQLDAGNVLYHNGNLTLARLDDWLQSIFRGRMDATPSERSVTLMTGESGATMFHNMVASDASNFMTVDTHYISGSDPRSLIYGVQFTRYRGKNGLDVTLILNPLYDSLDYCPERHPVYTEIPIDSWRMDVMDIGTTKGAVGESAFNMTMVCEKFADYYFTTAGKWDPKTGMPINDGGPGIAGGVGGYSTSIEKSFGLLIKDITRCASIQLRFDE